MPQSQKNVRTSIVSRACLASVPIRLTRFEGSFSRRDFTLGISCTRSIITRSVRIRASFVCAGEHGLDLRLVEERAWERREGISRAESGGRHAGLDTEGFPPIPGAGIIAEYLDETHGLEAGNRRLLPVSMAERIEVRRLMAWFNEKFFEEASNPLVTERIYKRYMSDEHGGGSPATDVIRAAKVNVRYHLAYIGWLSQTRNFLAGDRLTYADLAAAAHLSAIDYLGDVPWHEDEAAKAWYARVKSRPSFRPLLSERLAGVPARGPTQTWISELKLSPVDLKAALARQAKNHGFDCIGIYRRRMPSARPGNIPRNYCCRRATATWTGSRPTPKGAAIPAPCGPACAPSSCLA